ncbi:MAG: thermonuclease family protein [Gammaproteobacteria bacterium]|nr:thermonuclease family protein [Gammaproteobacteria bacterium]
MSKSIICGVVLLFSSQVCATGYPATLVEVKDGDTIRLAIHVWPDQVITTNVRVVGIDTPEKGWRAKCPKEAELGMAATAYTTEFVSGESQITVHNIQHGKFAGRMLGTVKVSGVDLGQVLLAAGLAREYAGGKRGSWCD